MYPTLLLLFGCMAIASAGVAPTTVPFGGIPTVAPTNSVGQVVTGISDIVSFSFWVALSDGPSDPTATASIALWSYSAPGAVVGTTGISLPTIAGPEYTRVTLNTVNLDPLENYVIYITTSGSSNYVVFTSWTDDGSVGGLVKARGSGWRSGFDENVLFDLTFNSVLQVNSATNWAQGHGVAGWSCKVQTSFSSIQVNWQTLMVYTGYFGSVTDNILLYGSPSCTSSTWAPYGTANACWDLHGGQAWAYANLDLSGTPYYVDDTFTFEGYLASGLATYSNNNQTVHLAASGDCGFAMTPSAKAAGELASQYGGGFYLQLGRL